MIRKLDAEEYSTMESVVIKIPLSIPYASSTEDFERVNGEFEYQGEVYRMVKQRLSHDTLFVVCIKDHHQKKLDLAEASFVKKQVSESSDDHVSPLPPVGKDYVIYIFSITGISSGWQRTVDTSGFSAAFIASFYPSIFLPPDVQG